MTTTLYSCLARVMCLMALALLSACTTAPGRTTNNDPWVGYNRTMYKVNDAVDRATLKPVAKGYQAITPSWVRTGIRNFFTNLGTPWVMVNQLLQGKPTAMLEDTGRLLVNTVVGVGGFIDVASKMNIPLHQEDFGQTLAVWGVPSGPFVTLPIFGPSNVRDGFARIPDFLANPARQANMDTTSKVAVSAVDAIQTRESLLSLDATLAQAYDPYTFVRDAWVQRREYLIYDGNPPEENLEDFGDGDPAADSDDATDKSMPVPQDETEKPAESTPPAGQPDSPTTEQR